MKPFESITVVLGVVFGLIGWRLQVNGYEWLSSFCVAPPLVFYLAFALRKSELNKNQPE